MCEQKELYSYVVVREKDGITVRIKGEAVERQLRMVEKTDPISLHACVVHLASASPMPCPIGIRPTGTRVIISSAPRLVGDKPIGEEQ